MSRRAAAGARGGAEFGAGLARVGGLEDLAAGACADVVGRGFARRRAAGAIGQGFRAVHFVEMGFVDFGSAGTARGAHPTPRAGGARPFAALAEKKRSLISTRTRQAAFGRQGSRGEPTGRVRKSSSPVICLRPLRERLECGVCFCQLRTCRLTHPGQLCAKTGSRHVNSLLPLFSLGSREIA